MRRHVVRSANGRKSVSLRHARQDAVPPHLAERNGIASAEGSAPSGTLVDGGNPVRFVFFSLWRPFVAVKPRFAESQLSASSGRSRSPPAMAAPRQTAWR